MKILIILVSLVALLAGGFTLWSPVSDTPVPLSEQSPSAEDSARAAITEGRYVVDTEESRIMWAGKKPLIEGYINSGSLGVQEGALVVEGETVSGTFTIDMQTLLVSDTPTKPGRESALEEHLKGERWFDVAQYPTATFEIVEVAPRADSAATFTYDVRGALTLKGQTHELLFPAIVYEDEDGTLTAEASLEFDRTLWGLTASSGSFFDNLADNAVDNMVALSFTLVAERAE